MAQMEQTWCFQGREMCVCVCLYPAAAGETLSRRSLQLPLCGCLLTSSNGLMGLTQHSAAPNGAKGKYTDFNTNTDHKDFFF